MLVEKFGTRNWTEISKYMLGRTAKQCREKWLFDLSPDVQPNRKWTKEEDDEILRLQKIFGNKWRKYEKYFEGRSQNAIKNHYNSSIKPKM